MEKSKKKISLTLQITIGLVLGIIVGLLLQNNANIATDYIKPIGTIYLNLIKMIVVPVVLLSIIQGIIIVLVAAEMFLSGFKSKLIFSSAKKALAQKEEKA